MSSVDIYTDLVLRTAQFSGALKSADAEVQRVVQKWSNTGIDIAVKLTLPDTKAVQQVLGALRAESVEIPVHYAIQGQTPAGAALAGSAGGRFGSNTAGNAGGSLALTNGRPGVDPLGIAGGNRTTGSPVAMAAAQTVSSGDLGQALEALRSSVVDLRDEMADVARQFEAAAQAVNRVGGGQSQGAGSSVRSRPSQRQATPARANKGPNNRQQRRMQRVQNFANGLGKNNANGFNNLGKPQGRRGGSGAGGGHGRGGRRGLGSFINSHPSLSRLFGGLGVAYEASAIAGAVTNYADSTYIPTGNVASLGKRQAIAQQDALRRGIETVVPVFGGMATNIADLGGAGLNWATGHGFVTSRTRMEYEAQQQDVASDVGYEGRRNDRTRGNYSTYDPRERARNDAAQRADDLEQKLLDSKYRDRNDTTKLNESGQKLKDSTEAANYAQSERERRVANLTVAKDEGAAVIEQSAAAHRASGFADRASDQYDRRSQLDQALRPIDDRLATRRNEVKSMDEGPEKARQERILSAQEDEAKFEKAAKQHEMEKQWRIEDSLHVASTEAANLRATGNYYDAVELEAKAAADARIKHENDVATKTKLINEAAAQEAERLYKRQEQLREQTRDSSRKELRTGGRAFTADADQINQDAIDQGKIQGIVEEKIDPLTGERTGVWADTANGIDPLTGKPYDQGKKDAAASIDRQKRARLAELEKQQRYGTEDIGHEADAIEGHLKGDDYGARQRTREATRDRQLADNDDEGPEGNARRSAIRSRDQAQAAQERRDKDDDLRREKLAQRQAELRRDGRSQMAGVLGDQVDAAEQIREVVGDKERLPARLARLQSEMEAKLVGTQRSESFGSVAEYSQRNFQAMANSDQGATAAMQAMIKQIGDALAGPSQDMQKAADAMMQTWQRVN